VDYIDGQKTGFFLNQKYNRAADARCAAGAEDAGLLHAYRFLRAQRRRRPAARVTAVDSSESRWKPPAANARAHRPGGLRGVRPSRRFDYLAEAAKSGERRFDYIILDPPAFTKSGATVKGAYRGYKEINMRAMRLLPRGGFLATCSCSHFMTDERFRRMLAEAAADAADSLRQIEERKQSLTIPSYGAFRRQNT
jgi:23S rRNA (cytosine1962-C5)-methyltransferase